MLLTTSSVNGYALKLLADQGIAVATEIKPKVINKLARLTKADVITSIDKLAMNPKLGRCGEFEQRMFVHENVKCTYFYFTGCNTDLGFTVVLRGSNKEILGRIKKCIPLMAYIYLNVKLESGLMRDQCLQASEYKSTEQFKPLIDVHINSYREAYEEFKNRLLSSSPWVSFKLPYILTKLEECIRSIEKNETMHAQFHEFYQKNYKKPDEPVSDAATKQMDSYKEFFCVKIPDEYGLPFGDDDVYRIINENFAFKVEFLKSEIATLSKQWDHFWQIRRQIYLDPTCHQRIVTLFSMVSTKNATPCIGPDIHPIDFYWENDLSLGQFIEHICLHADDVCTDGCQLTLKDHFRSYVHGTGKVDVVLENNPHMIQGKENIIMSWSYCRICHNTTPALPLSDNAWKYSFGKYLELSFWCRGMRVKGATCEHDFYRDQIHYFSFQHLAVRVEYTDIETLQLVPPKFQLFWQPEYDIKIKIETYHSVLAKAAEFFDSVRGRLNRVKVDRTG
ncbi:unnamed protein product [Ambrosiozyma monospora]|uniref:Unnamed protein product n=1 Tax=Ambrosiozyma monospora TaxID=43982 RepID=A0ACB5TKB6_AMBMO|nr:unnamed protein product [Ambrosiozyma monospora]